MINQSESYIESEIDNLTFKKFVDNKRREMAGEEGYKSKKSYYPLSLIAEKLGVSKEMLQKRINKQKPTTKRDFIIGVCAVLGCNSAETNQALRLYDYMPALDTDNRRDDCIIDYLEEHAEQISSIEDVDSFLTSRNLPKLNIIDHRGVNKNCSKYNISRPYKVIKKTMRTYYDEGDRYDSLETAYDFRNKCAVVFIVEKSKNDNILLQAWSDGKLMIGTFTNSKKPQIYNNPDEAGEYSDYFREMLQLAIQEQRKIDEYLNDTKNYPFRFSANLKNDSIHIFYEQFNYTYPERNEYYMMEYINRCFRFSISNRSMFMQEYLSQNEYNTHFRTYSNTNRTIYNSELEIQNQLDDLRADYYEVNVLKSRLNAFKTLGSKVEEVLEQLRERKIFVRNHNMIWDCNSVEVCRYFGVESEFECIYDENSDELFANKSQIKLNAENGKIVTLSLNELRRAFELGYTDISQICRVKHRYGNIEAVMV